MSKIIIDEISPKIILPGANLKITGRGFDAWKLTDNDIIMPSAKARIMAASENTIIVEVPENTKSGYIYIKFNGDVSNKIKIIVPQAIAENLHNVDNPVIDSKGNIFATFSGSRGQTAPVSIFKIKPPSYEKQIFITDIPNPTSMVIAKDGILYVSSRMTGKIYKCFDYENYEIFAQGLGVAFGLSVNSEGEMFVGDRTGSLYHVYPNGQAIFYRSIPQSYIAYHMGFDNTDNLYITNPIHMGENSIIRINRKGHLEEYHTNYSMFHGFCFDKKNNMYIAESKRSISNILKISPKKKISNIMSGKDLLGVCMDINQNLIVSTKTSLYLIEKKYL